MKKISLLAVLVLSLFTYNCEQFGLFGYSGIKGSEVKKRILDAANFSTFVQAAILRNSVSGSALGTAVIFTIVIDGIVVPGLAGISDSKHYKVETVEDCENKLKSTGVLLGNWIGAITCNLETSPNVIEIGPIELF